MRIAIPVSIFLLIALAIVSMSPAYDPQSEVGVRPYWKIVNADPPFGERMDHAVVVFQDRMWLLGGDTSREWKNDVWVTDDGKNWELILENAPWTPRSHHQSLVFDDRIWVIGGNDGGNLSDVWASKDGIEWQLITEEAPFEKRTGFSAEVLGDQILILGGQGDWDWLNDVWATRDGKEWVQLTDNAPWQRRSHFASVVHHDKLFISGGGYFDFDSVFGNNYRGHFVYLGDVWSSTDGIEWEQKAEFTIQGSHAKAKFVSLGEHIIQLNGDTDPFRTAINRHLWISKDGVEWQFVRQPTGGRHDSRNHFAFVKFKNQLWSMGGANYYWTLFNYENNVMVLRGDYLNLEEYIRNPPPLVYTIGDPNYQP